MNLFVVQSFREVVMGSLPFVGLMFLLILVLIAFPPTATWLPSVFAASRT